MSKLSNITKDYLDNLLEEQRDGYQNDLQPFEAYKNQMFENLSVIAESYHSSVNLGYKTLLDELKRERELNHDTANLRPFDEFLIKKENIVEEETETMQEKVGLSVEVLRDMYEVAVRLFQEKHHERTRNILIFLLSMNPYIEVFWIALGRVFEAEHDQNSALEAYKMAIFAEPEAQDGYDNSTRCCINLEKWEDAEIILNAGIEVIEKNESLKTHLTELIILVKRKKGGE